MVLYAHRRDRPLFGEPRIGFGHWPNVNWGGARLRRAKAPDNKLTDIGFAQRCVPLPATTRRCDIAPALAGATDRLAAIDPSARVAESCEARNQPLGATPWVCWSYSS
jgi:hypothetical protein